jgi:outer membrane receptor protein involved in Fe transport
MFWRAVLLGRPTRAVSFCGPNPEDSGDDLALWNFRLNWDSPTELWSAALTVTNLTDEFYYESQFGNGLATNFSITRRPGWPRETFLTVKRRFE